MSTNIEWCDETDNIIRAKEGGWWCQKISEGCLHCFAEKLNQNPFFGGNKNPYSGQPPELELNTEIIHKWAFQRKPKNHFISSMTDIFGHWVPRPWHFAILDGMLAAPSQTFQILTKRPGIMLLAINEWLDSRGLDKLPNNIWTGVSVENQRMTEERIPLLLQIPAVVRFLSCEPLLEELDLEEFLRGLSWVIVGGESGPNSRPCHLEWLQSIVSQCKSATVPAFVKQVGANAYLDEQQFKTRDKKGGDMSEFIIPLQVREFPILVGN